MTGHSRIRLLALLAAATLGASEWAVAESPQTDTPAASASSTSEESPREDAATQPPPPATPVTLPTSGDVVYRKSVDGRWRAVPVGDEPLPSLIDLLPAKGQTDPDVPEYFISKLLIDGSVKGDVAELTAHLEIRTLAQDRWLRVPLRFDQGVLLNYDYQGEGEVAPAVTSKADAGLVWMLRGKGLHTLTLSLRVPLRQTASGSQLLLSLPERPESFGGELHLQLPPASFVEPSETVRLSTPQPSEGTAQVEGLLPGDRIDLRWHPIVEEAAPSSRTRTDVTVRLRDDRVQLAARQQIHLRSSGSPSVDVRLPSGGFTLAEPIRITDVSQTERQVEPLPSDREGWVRVPLEGMLGAVRLDWLFERPFDESTHQLVIDGLEVAGADDQSGTISIEGFDRHLLTRRSDATEGVSRIGVDELPAAGAFANLAYRFQTGSYRLVLDIDPIESTFRVTPIYVLELTESRARLTARFLMNVDEGQVDALSLVWPQFEKQGWTIEPAALDGGELRRDEVTETGPPVEGDTPAVPATTPDGATGDGAEAAANAPARWLLKPANPLSDRSHPGLAAERVITTADRQAALTIQLPQVVGARMLPGWCVVVTADDVEVNVAPLEGTVLTRREGLPADLPIVLNDIGDQARSVYELYEADDAEELGIDVSVKVQPRRIRVRSLVTVNQIETNPQITQSIDFGVEFGRMSSVRLRLPEGIVDDIPEEFRDDALVFSLDGQPLDARWRGTSVELTFPVPRRGSFQIVAGPYKSPETGKNSQTFTTPVIVCPDHPYESLRLAVPSDGTAAIDVPDSRWTRLTTVVGSSEWMTTRTPDRVEIKLDHSLERVPQQLSIATAWIVSQVDASGNVRTTAQYELGPGVTKLVVQLPEHVVPPAVTWDGVELSSSRVTPLATIDGQYLIERPDSGRGWLGIAYTTRGRPLGWSCATSIAFPSFGGNMTVEQTFWEVRLPRTHHLLTKPDTLSPQYEWTRDGLVWRRTPAAGFEDVRTHLIAQGASPNIDPEASNSYPFETLGVLHEVKVRSMSSSLLVFLGAGLTLVASFLVLKVPAARSLWVWLTLGACGAVVSLWHLDAVLLLLQPAVYGMILPIVAAVLDRLTTRRSVIPESFSSRGSFDLNPDAAADSGLSGGSSFDMSMPSTLVRPKALSDSGVR